MLVFLFVVPLLGCLHVMISNSNEKKISLNYSILTMIISCIISYHFDSSFIGPQIISSLSISNFFSFELALDGLSLIFILLTTFTVPLCILASWNNLNNPNSYFHVIILSFIAFTNLLWLANDLFLFYIAFEAVLIPLFLIIGVYSNGMYKIRAAYLLFLYTFSGSLFMLLGFTILYYHTGTSTISILINLNYEINLQKYVWLAIFLSFAIKTPIIPFHNWILRAHVEAPVAGSIILAGLTLKIATYGILRILLPILPEASLLFAPLANTFAIISIVYASLAAIRQSDIKCLVAYSSIAHMGITILGIFSNSFIGIHGALILSLAHGFVSPALFFIVGAVIYDRYHTRVIKYYRGLTIFMPLTMIFFFIFTLANIGTPGTINWIGELFSLSGSFEYNPYIGCLGSVTVFLSACYSIWLFNRIAFGKFSKYLTYTTDLTRREFVVLISFIIPTLGFGLYPNFITNLLNNSILLLIF